MSEETKKEEIKKDDVLSYFNNIKSKKQKVDDKQLKDIYENCLILLDKYNRTNQIDAMKKLNTYITMIERERAALSVGIDTFVYKKDVEEIKKYFESVKRHVKMIELSRYEREIPDDIIDKFEKVRHCFDEFIIVFTDYTEEQEHEKKTVKERDPILFGIFLNEAKTAIRGQRMYFIGDWIDEYCDLTLDKLVDAMSKENRDKTVLYKFRDPKNIEEIRQKILAYDEEKKKGRMINQYQTYNDAGVDKTATKKGFIHKIFTAINKLVK